MQSGANYDEEGFTSAERRALARKVAISTQGKTSASTQDRFGVYRCALCGRVEPCDIRHNLMDIFDGCQG